MAEALKVYSKFSFDLPAIQRVLTAAQTAPVEVRGERETGRRKLIIQLGPKKLRAMIDDVRNGMSTTAAARKYGVGQTSVSRYATGAPKAEHRPA